MHRNYFDQLGNQLCKIKDSPFSRLQGAHSPKAGFSFDPDRLFNPSKQVQGMDKQYIQFKKDEQEKLQEIEYDMLKKNMNKEYSEKVKKMSAMLQHHKRPYTWFKQYRGMCQNCTKCGQYQGYFNHCGENNLQLMQCVKCHCAMNSHVKMPTNNPYRGLVWKHLSKQEMKDAFFNINYLVLAFGCVGSAIGDYGRVLDLLGQLGCGVVDGKVVSKLDFQIPLIKLDILDKGVEKDELEKALNLLDALQGEQEWKWETNDLPLAQFYEQLYQMIKKTIYNLSLNLKDDDKVLVVLVKYQYRQHEILKKAIKSLGQQLKSFHYVWSSKSRKQAILSCQYFFKQYFKIKYEIFLLPGSQEHKQQSDRFNDILDYNGVILMVDNLKKVKRSVFQSTFKQFSTNKLNYILGEELVSQHINRVGIKLCARVGLPQLTLPFQTVPDFLTISKNDDVNRAMSNLYPDLVYSQRCAIIIRPFLITCNFQEILINLLRINGFILIKRIRVKLSEEEARYLATLEYVKQDQMNDYVQMMIGGVCEIVVVSKRSAIYEAHSLLHGCTSGRSHFRSHSIKEKPLTEFKVGRETYDYDIPFNVKQDLPTIFQGFQSAINLESVLLGEYTPETYATTSRGEVLKMGQKVEGEKIKGSHMMREKILKELQTDSFNYWCYSSKSETITEQIAGIFLPEITLVEPITVIVKPGFTHYTTLIKQALLHHKYHIIMDKEIHMSKLLAQHFISSCQKVKLSKPSYRYLVECYSSQRTHLISVSKVAARTEMMSLLRGFTFVSKRDYVINEYIEDEILADMLVPVWNREDLCLGILAEPLRSMEDSVQKLEELSTKDRLIVLNYLVGSIYAVSINDLTLSTKLGVLFYYLPPDLITPKMQSWYYSIVSQLYPNYVPLLFQYRFIGESVFTPQHDHESSTVFCLQSDQGQPFMNHIIQAYKQEKQRLQESAQSDRKSIVLFLWSKKLAQFLLDLTEVRTSLKDFGVISEKNGNHQGIFTKTQVYDKEQNFLEMMHSSFEQREIKKNIKKLLSSRHLKERYEEENKRLVPSFELLCLHDCIRVVQKSEISKLHLMDRYTFIDPNQEHNTLKDMHNLNLFNVVPEIKTKYSLLADMYYYFLLQEYLDKQSSEVYYSMNQLYCQALTEIKDIEVLQYQIYLRILKEYHQTQQAHIKNWLFGLVRSYPNLKKGKVIDREDDVSGKKRKYLDSRQYYLGKQQVGEEEKQKIYKEYMEFDLRQLQKQMEGNNIYNPQDPFHQRIAKGERKINLLREVPASEGRRTGIFVEFEKKTTENQQLIKTKLKGEVEKFSRKKEDEVLYQTALEKNLWYRKSKGESSNSSKTSDAIQKQIDKFLSFKKENQ